jgi:hypothetical protein
MLDWHSSAKPHFLVVTQMPLSDSGGAGFISGRSVWDLWWTKHDEKDENEESDEEMYTEHRHYILISI